MRLPYLDVWIETPIFSVRSEVIRRHFDVPMTVWIGLKIRLFGWRWEVALYEPDDRGRF